MIVSFLIYKSAEEILVGSSICVMEMHRHAKRQNVFETLSETAELCIKTSISFSPFFITMF